MLVFLQKTDVMIGQEQISDQLNMIPITSLATPQKAKATRVLKEKALLVAAPCQANKAKAKGKARAILKENPKVCLLYIVFDESFGICEFPSHDFSVTGKDHGADKNSVDFSSKPGHVGLGGRFFKIETCIDNLVNVHNFDRQKASRMCFPVGLTLFQGNRALRCCGLEKTPGHEGLHSKYHSFPDGWANEMRSSLSNNQGNFRQPALS
jgi:hypothetical protein